MEISINTEVPKDFAPQVMDDGGVWLVVAHNDERYISYLAPSALIAWVEGDLISNHVDFPGLPEAIYGEVCRKFDAKLREIVQ
jgi:hypothetical protein